MKSHTGNTSTSGETNWWKSVCKTDVRCSDLHETQLEDIEKKRRREQVRGTSQIKPREVVNMHLFKYTHVTSCKPTHL